MNEELKLRHLATITHESAVEMYEKLCAACEPVSYTHLTLPTIA